MKRIKATPENRERNKRKARHRRVQRGMVRIPIPEALDIPLHRRPVLDLITRKRKP